MRTADHLASALSLLTGTGVTVELRGTDSVPVRAERRSDAGWSLRLHPCFLLAAEDVLRDLAQHLRAPTRHRGDRLREFARVARVAVPARPARRPPLEPVGRHHDLAQICDRINREHFGGALRTRITWGKAALPRRRRRRSIVFGSYDAALDLVRVHPELDSPRVPHHFVDYIVHHELLHAAHPVQVRADGRRVIHSAAFVRDERRIPGIERALAYLRKWEERGFRA